MLNSGWLVKSKKDLQQCILDELLELANMYPEVKFDIDKMTPMWFLMAVYNMILYIKAETMGNRIRRDIRSIECWDKTKEDK